MSHRVTTRRRRFITAVAIGEIATHADTVMIEDAGTIVEMIGADDVASRRRRDSAPGAVLRWRTESLRQARLEAAQVGIRLLRISVPVAGRVLDLSAPGGVSRAYVHRTDGHLAESPGDVEHVGGQA